MILAEDEEAYALDESAAHKKLKEKKKVFVIVLLRVTGGKKAFSYHCAR